MGKTVLIAGATGLIGSNLLSQLLLDNHYSKVIALVRKPIDIKHPHLEQCIADFEKLQDLNIAADDVFCCLGTTIAKVGSQEAFEKVDYYYPLQLAKVMYKNGAKQFLLVSALGANVESGIFYNRIKGKVEKDIAAIGYSSFLVFRPSLLLGKRTEFRLGERMFIILTSIFNFVFIGKLAKYKPVKASQVAFKMLQLANNTNTKGLLIIENNIINT